MSDMRLFLAAALLGAFTLAACAPTTAPATRTSCGGRGEPACTLDQQLTRLVPACQPGLEELYLPLGSCFPAEHLARPTTHAWPGAEATPGSRSVFLVHGMTGSVASFSPSARHLAAALRASGHHVFNVDYNADSDIPRGLALYELRNDQWQPAGLYGKSLSGTTLTITEVAASLRDAILSNAASMSCASLAHGWPRSSHSARLTPAEASGSPKSPRDVVCRG